jgi:hypothetical protein
MKITAPMLHDAWRATTIDFDKAMPEYYGTLSDKSKAMYEAMAVWLNTTLQESRPQIVCLCGSSRFSEAFRQANLVETLAGKIVLTIGCEWHSDQALGLTEADKQQLDKLHLRKIDLADIVYVLNVGGYIGDSTRREIEYAREQGKAIRWLEPLRDEKGEASA